MKKAKLFTNGRSQAVRLPKEFRFKGDSVNIRKVGNTVVLSPEGEEEEEMGLGDRLFAAAKMFSPDFMADGRCQPEQQVRKSLEEFFK
jgi:antitoxin VapB